MAIGMLPADAPNPMGPTAHGRRSAVPDVTVPHRSMLDGGLLGKIGRGRFSALLGDALLVSRRLDDARHLVPAIVSRSYGAAVSPRQRGARLRPQRHRGPASINLSCSSPRRRTVHPAIDGRRFGAQRLNRPRPCARLRMGYGRRSRSSFQSTKCRLFRPAHCLASAEGSAGASSQ